MAAALLLLRRRDNFGALRESAEVDMPYPARTALVLQGGGALGAYELGAARRLYRDGGFAPGIIAGVSIGAITSVLLARPAKGMKPLEALEAFWQRVAIAGPFLVPPLRPYASLFGNPSFFMPRLDYYAWPTWTNFYLTEPLRATLSQLVDLDALADPSAPPGLLVSATDIEAGQIEYFYSGDRGLSLDHIVASASLPPSFPMTVIGGKSYWDGGLFDNTPLGAVLDRLDTSSGAYRTIYVVNLFPNKAPVPGNLLEVQVRTQNLQFANRTLEDLKMLHRVDEVAALMEALETLPEGNPLKNHPAYQAVAKRHYVRVPCVVSITRPEQVECFGGSDFSPETIEQRASEGYRQTEKALQEAA
ncbi:MAG: patatin-like phospholipase family protein [Methylocapsa sp.]|nr:patatin-like phospholipase family protein [Methylocapsa sp.]